MNERTGAGVVLTKENEITTSSEQLINATVFQAELQAIEIAPKSLLQKRHYSKRSTSLCTCNTVVNDIPLSLETAKLTIRTQTSKEWRNEWNKYTDGR